MHIQIAHFFTADPYLALFVALALYFMIRRRHHPARGPDRRPRILVQADCGTSYAALCNL